MGNLSKPPIQVPIVGSNGAVTASFGLWLMDLFNRVGADNTELAPADAAYLVSSANSALAGAQVLANEAAGVLQIIGKQGQVATIPPQITNISQTLVSNVVNNEVVNSYATVALSSNFVCSCIAIYDLNVDSYDNGVDGVGATLTKSLGFSTIDGLTLTAGMIICVNGQNSHFQNGIYSLDSSRTILTRIPTYNTANMINVGDSISVEYGASYADSIWYQDSFNPTPDSTDVIGANDISFFRIVTTGSNELPVWSPSCANAQVPQAGDIHATNYYNGPNDDGQGAYLFFASGVPTISSISPVAGTTVLIAGQTDLTQNGIYYIDSTLQYLIRSPFYDNSPGGQIVRGGLISVYIPQTSIKFYYLQTSFDTTDSNFRVGHANITFVPTLVFNGGAKQLAMWDSTGEYVTALSPNSATNVVCMNSNAGADPGAAIVTPAGASGTVLMSNGVTSTPTFQALPAGGSVTSVTFTGDGVVLSNTPSSAVTTSGTVTASLNTQTANKILAGPVTGSAAAPTFRSLVNADLPVPVRPQFDVYCSTNQSIPSSVVTKILFNTRIIDTNTNFDITTNHRFTPTVAGNYLVTVNVVINTGAAVYLQALELFKSGSLYAENIQAIAYSANETTFTLTRIIPMNGSTDYLEVYMFQNSGSAFALVGGAATVTMSGALLV